MISWFLPERRPRQYLLAGEKSLTVFRREGRRLVEGRRLEGLGLADLTPDSVSGLAGDLQRLETGLLLSPTHFIIHIFEFDRLPWPSKSCRELVRWKLQKTFPENIDLYDHRFFRLDHRRVFSILARRSLLDHAEELFARLKVELTFVGSTTVSLLNRRRLGAGPDLLVEIDQSVLNLLFMKNGRPAYVRRSKTASPAEYAGEIAKTVQYVIGNQGLHPRRFQVTACGGPLPDLSREAELAELGLIALPPPAAADWIRP